MIPFSQSTLSVKLINPVNAGPSRLHRFMAPAVPGMETHDNFPSFSFLLEHTASGRKLVWDLGIRKDYQNYSPKIASYIPTTGYNIQVEKNVADILAENGVRGKDVEAVIWSHWHWDHIGDPSTFPPTTDLVVGPGFKEALLPGAPANPDSPIQESDYSNRNLREITFTGPNTLQIGPFRAYDYFSDGSFYLLDTPGHAIGHLCGLARTTPSPNPTFILLGGDVCHNAAIFRPSPQRPIPEKVTIPPFSTPSGSRPGYTICPGHAWESLQTSRGRKPNQPLFDATFGYDIPLAMQTRDKLQEVDALDEVLVIIAHDAQVRDAVPHFPEALNGWRGSEWAKGLRWAFLDNLEPYWRETGSLC
ncbi:Metallo-hydrolase/oxidoreductase [Aspergillus taichungensis]|uniref:Metallo-hydrolase/oxidoreductase n=1 Tax=Aspergillus taichungensis TaxID=482145 RepID=A0A2J5HMI9_9EURO|nr:Metallo-hydrolase/oxidoreductase [Aspergillus taichungensis]